MAELKAQEPKTPDATTIPPKRKRSAGEVAFNRIVYTGIGFGVNEASSLWITDQFLHGKNLLEKIPGLKKIGEWFSETGFNRASEFVARTFKLAEKTASDGSKILPKQRGGNSLLMVTLLSGGTLLLLPMKWLENNKIYWVKKANHAIDRMQGSKLTPEQVAARDAEVEQHIACSPRQSWPSLLMGRIIAISASFVAGTTLMGQERNTKLMNWSEKLFTGSLQSPGAMNAAHRYARLASVETYSCATSSLVLEIMSKFVAKRKSAPHDPDICHDTAMQAAATPVRDNNKEADCGCGPHSMKILSRREQAAGALQAMQV